MIFAFAKVFRHSSYILLAFGVAVIVFAGAVWLPNIRLIVDLISTSGIPLSEKILLPLDLLKSITTNFTIFSALYTIAMAVLFGIYVAMTTYLFKRRIKQAKGLKQAGMLGTGFLGLLSGVLGVGCAACGSFILTSVLALGSASGSLTLLPFGGEEFGVIGVVLLVVAISITGRQINDPQVCAAR